MFLFLWVPFLLYGLHNFGSDMEQLSKLNSAAKNHASKSTSPDM